MAHFARLDENNMVIRVHVLSNHVLVKDGEENEQQGVELLQNLHNNTDTYVQTSYNNNFRKKYAGIGDIYDKTRDAFILPQPQNFDNSYLTVEYEDDPVPSYISNYFAQSPSGSIPYILNEDSCQWEAPVAYPDDDKDYSWDEDSKAWVEVTK